MFFEGDSYLKPRECLCVTENGTGAGEAVSQVGFVLGTLRDLTWELQRLVA